MVCIFEEVEGSVFFWLANVDFHHVMVLDLEWFSVNTLWTSTCSLLKPKPRAASLFWILHFFFQSATILIICNLDSSTFPSGMFTLSTVGWLKFPVTIAFSLWQLLKPPTISWLQFLESWTLFYFSYNLCPLQVLQSMSCLPLFNVFSCSLYSA